MEKTAAFCYLLCIFSGARVLDGICVWFIDMIVSEVAGKWAEKKQEKTSIEIWIKTAELFFLYTGQTVVEEKTERVSALNKLLLQRQQKRCAQAVISCYPRCHSARMRKASYPWMQQAQAGRRRKKSESWSTKCCSAAEWRDKTRLTRSTVDGVARLMDWFACNGNSSPKKYHKNYARSARNTW